MSLISEIQIKLLCEISQNYNPIRLNSICLPRRNKVLCLYRSLANIHLIPKSSNTQWQVFPNVKKNITRFKFYRSRSEKERKSTPQYLDNFFCKLIDKAFTHSTTFLREVNRICVYIILEFSFSVSFNKGKSSPFLIINIKRNGFV